VKGPSYTNGYALQDLCWVSEVQ